jgi:hypothetical protein
MNSRVPGGVALIVAAAAMGALVPVLFGAPQPMVHVTWRGLGADARAQVERRLQLSEPRLLDADTWSYVPLDTSRNTLRALVRHPSVATTDGINRTAFRIASNPPLTPRRGGLLPGAPPTAARAAKLAAYCLLLAGIIVLFRAGVSHARIVPADTMATGRRLMVEAASPRGIATWLGRGVRVASPEAAGLFRITFGALVLAYVWSEPVYPALLGRYEVGAATGVYGAIVRSLAEHPAFVAALPIACSAFGVAFIAGVWTRVSFTAFTASVFLWASVLTLRTTAHAVSALLVTMVCLLVARWSDAWSVDALARRKRVPRPPPGKTYGFPMWVPCLVLGLTLAAAAWAKLQNGFSWILNGTVKYHFVSDLEHAWVDWGVRWTEWHGAAVLLSATAVVIEALVLTAAFSRSDRYRLAMGIAAAVLLGGFVLFQGVIWPGWWILLVGFLPWHRLVGTGAVAPEAGTRPLRPIEVFVLLCVIVQQLYVSARHVEARPVLSAYDMYSATYDSPENYEDASNLVYRVVAISGDSASELRGCLVDDVAAHAVEAAGRGDANEQERVRGLLGPCLSEHLGITMLRLEGDRKVYDWERRRFEWRRRLDVVGPVPADWLQQ